MRFAKIQFADRATAARAMTGLARQGRVTVLRDHVFIVPEPELDRLQAEGLSYRLLGGGLSRKRNFFRPI